MYVKYWVLIAAIVWFAVEFGVRRRGIRVALQSLIFLAFTIAAFYFGERIGRFEPTLEGNNHLKNLTRSLVDITSVEDVDVSLLHKRLDDLDNKIIATYESHSESREAIEHFLNSYDIEYEKEIPIQSEVAATDQ